MGRSESRKIYIHFYADWCSYCRKMTVETFSDPTVATYLNKNFIPIRVNMDRERQTAAKYNVRGVPTNWLLKKNGERIGVIPGFLPPDILLSILKEVNTMSLQEKP